MDMKRGVLQTALSSSTNFSKQKIEDAEVASLFRELRKIYRDLNQRWFVVALFNVLQY
jgi:hypothetical protein